MKVVIVQDGPAHEVLVLTSLLIGLYKKFQKPTIVWIGDSTYFDIVKYNKRISDTINLRDGLTFDSLPTVYGADICVNTSISSRAKKFTSSISAKKVYGFDKDGPTTDSAQFFHNVIHGNLTTNRSILDIYYDLVDLNWRGEGYGLSYYPKTRQNKDCGKFIDASIDVDCETIKLPPSILRQLDVLNQYATIVTDSLFVLHASLALRKHVKFYTSNLPYRIEYFKNGETIDLKD